MIRQLTALIKSVIIRQIQDSEDNHTRLVKVIETLSSSNSEFHTGICSVSEMLKSSRDFYLDDNQDRRIYYVGKEHEELLTPDALRDAVCSVIREGGSYAADRIEQILTEDRGLNVSRLTGGISLGEWLKTRTNEFTADQQGYVKQIFDQTGDAVNPEYALMLKIVFFRNLHQTVSIIKNHCFSDENSVIYEGLLARRFVMSILHSDSGLIDASGEETPRIAFFIGVYNEKGLPYYSVLTSNSKYEEYHKQYWMHEATVYPGELDEQGVGEWLKSHYRPAGVSYDLALFEGICTQLSVIRNMRPDALAHARSYLSGLESGRLDTGDDLAFMDNYDKKLAELREQLHGMPGLECETLEELTAFMEASSRMEAFVNRLLEKFHQLTQRVHEILTTEYLLPLREETTPQKDYRYVKHILEYDYTVSDFETISQILSAYMALAEAMKAVVLDEDTREHLEIACNHFVEIPFYPKLVLNHPLIDANQIEDIRALNSRCSSLLFTEISDHAEALPLATREEIADVLNDDVVRKKKWISLYSRVTDGDIPYGVDYLTPDRLLGEMDEATAEKLQLLSAVFEPEQSVPWLMAYYRNADDYECFRYILDCFRAKALLTGEDARYLVQYLLKADTGNKEDGELLQYLTMRFTEDLNEIDFETVQSLISLPQAALDKAASQTHEFNPLEKALISNAIDDIYRMLDDTELMSELEYGDELAAQIRSALNRGLPLGSGAMATACRVYFAQGDFNHTSRFLFWEICSAKGSADYLFDIYYDDGDYKSALWIAQNLNPCLTIPFERMANYARCLIVEERREELVAMVIDEPLLLYVDGILNILLKEERHEKSSYFHAIYQYNENHPFSEIRAFEKGVCSGNAQEVSEYLSDSTAMLEQGYTEEEILQIRKNVSAPYKFEVDRTMLRQAEDIYLFQRNTHRLYERLLYQAVRKDRHAVIKLFFELYQSEQRHYEAILFFEAYTDIISNDKNSIAFMKDLLASGDESRALQMAEQNPRLLSMDTDLYRMIIDAAENHPGEIDLSGLKYKVAILPRNPFEKVLINYKAVALTDYISNASKLLEMGYTHQEIQHFVDCYSKPFSKGDDPFSVGSRMRRFLGDVRSEPFFLKSESDARSARVLFDIYSKECRWDELCELYRRHDVPGDDSQPAVWNSHYEQLYLLALSRATGFENSDAYVRYVESNANALVDNPAANWNYFRALCCIGMKQKAEEKKTQLLDEPELNIPAAKSCLAALWSSTAEWVKAQALLLADDLLAKYRTQLNYNSIKQLMSIWICRDKSQAKRIIDILREHQLERAELILACIHAVDGGLENTSSDYDRTAVKLTEILAANEEVPETIILLALDFIEKISELTKPISVLCVEVIQFLFSHLDEIPKELFSFVFAKIENSMESFQLNDDIICNFIALLSGLGTEDIQTRYLCTLLGTNVYMYAVKNAEAASELSEEDDTLAHLDELRDNLIASWKSIFLEYQIKMPTQGWQTLTQFLHTADTSGENSLALANDVTNCLSDDSAKNLAYLHNALMFLDEMDVDFDNEKLIDSFISSIENGEDDAKNYMYVILKSLLKSDRIKMEVVSRLINKLISVDLHMDDQLNELVFELFGQRCPNLMYQWYKERIADSKDNADMVSRTDAERLLNAVEQMETSEVIDSGEITVLFHAAAAIPSIERIRLMKSIYQKTNNTDYLRLFTVLEACAENSPELEALFRVFLDESSIEWLERNAGLWRPFVLFSESDVKIENTITYIGTSDELVSEEIRSAVIHLLMRDLQNPRYIHAYLRLVPRDEQAEYKAKLEYFLALSDNRQTVQYDTICRFFEEGYPSPGISLLKKQMNASVNNSVSTGMMLGKVFTKENIARYPQLTEITKSVYQWIHKVNNDDPMGRWKNTGRLVEIACLTNTEPDLFDCCEEVKMYPGKSAYLCAHMIARGEMELAEKYYEKAYHHSPIDSTGYLSSVGMVLDNYRNSGTVSVTDQIVLRFIPMEGNQRNLEFYGALAHEELRMGHAKELYQAMKMIADWNRSDRGFIISCFMLSSAALDSMSTKEQIGEELSDIYHYIKLYLEQETFENTDISFLFRYAKSLLAIHACMDTNATTEDASESISSLLIDLVPKISKSLLSDALTYSERLKNILAVSGGEMLLTVLRGATGWWKIDETVRELIYTDREVARFLIDAFPSGFELACARAALSDNMDVRPILSAMGFEISTTVTRLCEEIKEEHRETVANLFNVPIMIPGLFVKVFLEAADLPDETAASAALRLLVSAIDNLDFISYYQGKYNLRQLVETTIPHRKALVERVMSRIIDPENKKSLGFPQTYMQSGNFEMMMLAAESQLQKPADIARNQFITEANYAYMTLGQIITGTAQEEELKKLSLKRMVNMAILLCQSPHYSEISRLFNLCPAKWRICLRCVQELIQGKPSNVLDVFKNRYLDEDSDCAAYIGTLAMIFATPDKNGKRRCGIELLKLENLKRGEDENWGVFEKSEILFESSKRVSARLLFVLNRNWLPDLTPFHEDIEKMVEEMRRDDASETSSGEQSAVQKNSKYGEGSLGDIRDYKTIPYVVEEVSKLFDSLRSEETSEEDVREYLKKELENCNPDELNPKQKAEYYVKRIALNWNLKSDKETHWCCVRLGLALFELKCIKPDNSAFGSMEATAEARETLLQMSDCLPRVMPDGIGSNLLSYLTMCLQSYKQLEDMVSDCKKHHLIELCGAFSDEEAKKGYQGFIDLVVSIGNELAHPLAVLALKQKYEEYIRCCQKESRSNLVIKTIYQKLIHLLNNELRILNSQASVIITVYNRETSFEEARVFGSVINGGGVRVGDVVLRLSLDGVEQNACCLENLESGEMMPFELPFVVSDEKSVVNCNIRVSYKTEDGVTKTADSTEAELKLYHLEEIPEPIPGEYNVSNPTDVEDYIERRDIRKIIEAGYGLKNGISRFPDLIIYGMKRTGKSSIMKYLSHYLSENYGEQIRSVVTSGEGCTDYNNFPKMVHSLFVSQVLTSPDNNFNTITSLYSDNPEWDAFEQKWKIGFEPTDDFSWLEAFYMELQKKFLKGVLLVVMIDEADILIKYRNSETIDDDFSLEPDVQESADETQTKQQSSLWGILSRITQLHIGNVKFVICGADYMTNMIIAGDNITQLFQRMKKLHVGRMSATEIEKAMRSIEERSDLRIHPDAMTFLWNALGGLPWHSKIIGNMVIESRLTNEKRSEIYPSDVLWALEKMLSMEMYCSDNNFGAITLSDDERFVIKQMAECAETPRTEVKVSKIISLFTEISVDEKAEERCKRAIGTLCTQRLLLKSEGVVSDRRLRFSCEVYRLYFRGVKVLDKFITKKGI